MTGPRPEDEPADEPTGPAEPADPPEADAVQEADEESFPASDPPAAWSGPGGG